MQKPEIPERFNELLDSFADRKMTYIGENVYRDDCWEIFIKTPSNTTADELRDSIQELFEPQSTKNQLKLELLKQLHNMLREWIYARAKLKQL